MPAMVNAKLLIPSLLAAFALGCSTQEGAPSPRSEQPIQISFLHTSDTHSRLLPYDFQIAATDKRIIKHYSPTSPAIQGSDPLVQMGGAARLATLIKRERAKGENVLWVDTGDPWQGAPIFNAFNGEPEFRFLSMLGVDLMVIGNHEFDKGQDMLARQLDKFANYPVLAANYLWERDTKGAQTLSKITKSYAILHAGGLKIGIIGMGDLSSMLSIGEGTNSQGIAPLSELETVQFWINHLAPQVDLVGLASHMGLTGAGERNEDYQVIAGTYGLDFVFGGHLHIVLDPPQTLYDAVGRPVVLTHSGAFMKYLGRLDMVVEDSGDPFYGYEVTSHRYNLFPVDASVEEDPATVRFLEPYILELNQKQDLTRIIAYAPLEIPRFGREKANSELGNLAAESMSNRRGVQADFGLTNTLGIRTDIVKGPITQDQMFNVFPFDNLITKLYMSGREICELMTFVARRSAGRGCQTQAQFSDRIHLKLNCIIDEPECSFASEVALRNQASYNDCIKDGIKTEEECDLSTREALDPLRVYQVAVNDYIAAGGSGFRVLKFNTTKVATDISIRDAVSTKFQSFESCNNLCVDQCVAAGSAENKTREQCETEIANTPLATSSCEYLSNCYQDVAKYRKRFCEGRTSDDPRAFCAKFRNGPYEALMASGGETDRYWGTSIDSWCKLQEAAAAHLSEGAVMEDDCGLADYVIARANLTQTTVEAAWSEYEGLLSYFKLPALSDKCECMLDANVTADAECRVLSCVLGHADNRLETELFETYKAASRNYAEKPDDLCATQAITVGCDIEDLQGIQSDDNP